MRLTVTIDPPKYASPAQMKKEIAQALKIFSAYYQKRVQQRFAAQGPGWPPRKSSDAAEARRNASVAALAEHKLKSRLRSVLRMSAKKLAQGKGTTENIVKKTRQLEELKRQTSGKQSPFFVPTEKEAQSVMKQRHKAVAKAASAKGQMLGRMANAMKAKITGMVLEVVNTVEFSAVQNEGGTVGHNAKIPARPFQFFDDTDLDVFSEIVTNCMIAALS